jgi:GntR family transcriptional repressor for pyruvate dehydrogenase complex
VTASAEKNRRLYLQLAGKLTAAISAGQYHVGNRLPAERELASRFSVSRSTVREAILSLETRGLVEVRMGSGVYVISVPASGEIPGPLDVGPFELCEARLLIEGEVAALAAVQITEEELRILDRLLMEMDTASRASHGEAADRRFHLTIARAARNNTLIAVIDSLWTVRMSSPQCVRLLQRSRLRGMKSKVAEHRVILNALRARNAGAARAAMRAHLRHVLDHLLDTTEAGALSKARARIAAKPAAPAAVRRSTAGARAPTS